MARRRLANPVIVLSLQSIQNMADDIPFDKDLEPDAWTGRSGDARRAAACCATIRARSPSRARSATSSAAGKVAIIDPGPDDPAHIAALLDAVRGETVTHIFVTHTHRDHSPGGAGDEGARPARWCWRRGRTVRRACSMSATRRGWKDRTTPTSSRTARSRTARSVSGAGWTMEAVTTPGHTANHMAFAFKEARTCCSPATT